MVKSIQTTSPPSTKLALIGGSMLTGADQSENSGASAMAIAPTPKAMAAAIKTKKALAQESSLLLVGYLNFP